MIHGVISELGTAQGYATLAVSTTAVALPAALSGTKENAQAAYVTVETNSVRYRVDGVDPTATEGHLMPATVGPETGLWIYGSMNVVRARFIRASADGTVKVTYYSGM